jgi:hypothetical protein
LSAFLQPAAKMFFDRKFRSYVYIYSVKVSKRGFFDHIVHTSKITGEFFSPFLVPLFSSVMDRQPAHGKWALALSLGLWICGALVCAVVYPILIQGLKEQDHANFLQEVDSALAALRNYVSQRVAVMKFLAGSLASFADSMPPRSIFDVVSSEADNIGIDDAYDFAWASSVANVSSNGILYSEYVESSYPGRRCELEQTHSNSSVLGDAVWPVSPCI